MRKPSVSRVRQNLTLGCATREGWRIQWGEGPRRANSQEARSSGGREEGNRRSGAHQEAVFGTVSESPGRSESERTGAPESEKPRRPSPRPWGEGSMARRNLADAAGHSGGVIAAAR